ncbi:MAG: hypothetical protein QOC60_1565 [Frankiaceae bacterium]|nr:hypothetical protein [Frankiaceae bacterium]
MVMHRDGEFGTPGRPYARLSDGPQGRTHGVWGNWQPN